MVVKINRHLGNSPCRVHETRLFAMCKQHKQNITSKANFNFRHFLFWVCRHLGVITIPPSRAFMHQLGRAFMHQLGQVSHATLIHIRHVENNWNIWWQARMLREHSHCFLEQFHSLEPDIHSEGVSEGSKIKSDINYNMLVCGCSDLTVFYRCKWAVNKNH